jgi:hypothetical protein
MTASNIYVISKRLHHPSTKDGIRVPSILLFLISESLWYEYLGADLLRIISDDTCAIELTGAGDDIMGP